MIVPGIRNSPSIRYASFTPPFGYDEEGTAFGGLFRDGRVPTLAEQAKLPFLDAREMANATAAEVIERLRRSPNAARFRSVFGAGALEDPDTAFSRLAAAIAQFEDPEKGNCAACHPNRPGEDGSPPLFTDFTYDNVDAPALTPAEIDDLVAFLGTLDDGYN